MGIKFSESHDSVTSLSLASTSLVMRGSIIDDRGDWSRISAAPCSELKEHGPTAFELELNGSSRVVRLRSRSDLERLVTDVKASFDRLYLDLTTLGHHLWAPVFRAAVEADLKVSMIYAEPTDYAKRVDYSTAGGFDLSDRIQRPTGIPGFTSIAAEFERNFKLIALLGFEGNRFEFIVSKLEPESWQLYPIIGVPGFKPEFPDHVISENSVTIEDSKCGQNIRYAAANCPFSLVAALEEIAREDETSLLKIAPLGTKPHALGALLFSMVTKSRVEFIYDHPVRKVQRSSGLGKVHVFDVAKFLDR
jgi:hypothetical protein